MPNRHEHLDEETGLLYVNVGSYFATSANPFEAGQVGSEYLSQWGVRPGAQTCDIITAARRAGWFLVSVSAGQDQLCFSQDPDFDGALIDVARYDDHAVTVTERTA